MKKYIGLTLYFMGIVLLSYSFFYISGKWKKTSFANSENLSWLVETTSGQTDNEDLSIVDLETWDNQTTQTFFTGDEDITSQTGDSWEVEVSSNFSSWDKILTGNQQQQTTGLKLGDQDLTKIDFTPYDDIYEILGYGELPAYQVPGKDIYIKQLKSVDYTEEKSNINQLIQKIWGNIKQTNLFGDKQLFVNPDIYYQKVVIMLIEYNGKLYLVTLPYDKYQQYKGYLKNVLFTK